LLNKNENQSSFTSLKDSSASEYVTVEVFEAKVLELEEKLRYLSGKGQRKEKK